ncbi:ARM repeat-containing protein [Nadsonia fulvescens var. elongata DSM 6958]|uniref:MMS19 nucleotide excision repair protein n=1 Tax=Nadsonia fulvescens var. elongata DSM 6958 TaxID=857566 RepID=A0A1E3PPE6_9ASCO|nr:ARM repeat-containing protein [Nadsonia fulvescens var. elongata DSM 6958]
MDRQLINTYIISDDDSSDSIRITTELAEVIMSGKAKLVELVQLLGDHLTTEDSVTRSKATSCISGTITQLKPETLTRQQVSVVTSFFSERLVDDESIKPVLSGLKAIVNMDNFSVSNTEDLLNSIFENVEMSRLTQSNRHIVFEILAKILNRHLNYIKSLGGMFVKGFIKITSGEKDPRNLMASFSINKVILEHFDITEFVEDLFDVTFCYFPITFQPPPNDPYKISSDDLKMALRSCISANDLFAKDAFPGLIEKLNSSFLSVKRDTLITMKSCVENYGFEVIKSNWKLLWNGIKFEVLHGSEEDVPDLTLEVLKAIASTLTKAPESFYLAEYLDTVSSDCNDKIKTPQGKLSQESARIVSSIAQSGHESFEYIINKSIPVVLGSCVEPMQIDLLRAVLDILFQFLDAAEVIYGPENKKDMVKTCPLVAYKDPIFGLLNRTLMGSSRNEVSLINLAIVSLIKLTQLKSVLDINEVGLIVQYLDEIILTEENENISVVALSGLTQIAKKNVNLILDITFPAFLSQLPDTDTSNHAQTDNKLTKKTSLQILGYLADLSSSKVIFEVLCIRLINKLDVVVANGASAQYIQAIFLNLYNALVKVSRDPENDLTFYANRFLPEIFTRVFNASFEEPEGHALRSVTVIDITANMFVLISRELSEIQESFILDLFDVFVHESPSSLLISAKYSRSSLLEGTIATNLVSIFVSALAPIQKEIPLPGVEPNQLLQKVIDVCKSVTNIHDRLGFLRLSGLIINKWITNSDSDSVASQLKSLMLGVEELNDMRVSISNLEIFCWISKGLVLRGDQQGYSAVNQLVSLFSHSKLGVFVCRALDIVFSDDDILCKENNVIIRLLSKHRLFSTVVPQLVEGFKSAEGSIQANYLVGLSCILRSVPSKVILPEVPKFISLLIQSLSLSDPSVKEATIDTLTVIMVDSSEVLSAHISTLIKQLLESSKPSLANTPAVRLAALNCLKLFPKTFKMGLLLPYKQQVIQELSIGISDAKRDVRKGAADCRQEFFELDIKN